MKRTTLSLLFVFIASFFCFSQDVWEEVVGDGFGTPNQKTLPEMEVFNGRLYAASSVGSGGQAKLWSTATGNIGSWTEMTSFSPDLTASRSIHAFGTSELDSGHFWCGTGNNLKGGMVYKLQNGTDWVGISQYGFGSQGQIGVSPHMVVFEGAMDTQPYLYAGIGSHGGNTPAQVWRTPYTNTDSMQWDLLMDFAWIDSGVTIITYWEVWGDTVYFGTDGGGMLWQSSDGTNFAQNPYVDTGFGDPTNFVFSSFEIFQDTMYVTTTNKIKGGQLWRSGNGSVWEQLTDNAFGKGNAVNELRSLRESFGSLWLTGYTDTSKSPGVPVWKSDNGRDFTQSNVDGFGDAEINGENSVTIGFGDYQYYGGPNYNAGSQIWRTSQTVSIESHSAPACDILVFPNPFSDYAQLSLGLGCKETSQVKVYSYNGELVASLRVDGANSLVISGADLSNGLYFYNVISEDLFVTSGKFVVQ